MTTPPNYDYSVSVDAEGVFTIVPEDVAPESPLPLSVQPSSFRFDCH